MKTNDSSNACPRCGATVPPEAPQGLCPQCVFAAAAAPEAAPTATSQIPSLERLAIAFPQLQIIELIGRGGMGFVFKARQPHLDRFVALKLLPDSLAHDPQFAERFNREGRVLARLNHPNIVSIFDFGHTGAPVSDPARAAQPNERAGSETGAPPATGFYYLMMEYVDGVNLRQAMQAGRFSPAEALAIVPKICEALQFAHEEGILHRDIKPENILLDAKGRVKIADFGIAKLVGEEHPDISLTATGAALGTMHYMAPEQIEKPATVDHRADIYSLGVVFYELLTGELPLGRFGPPSAKTPVDSRVDDVVMRTLEKEREKRFQSAGEMGTTVEHLTETGAGARPSMAKPTTVAPAEDFILCHPRLPRMAQFITIFALVVMPALWLIGLLTTDTTPHPNHYAEFVQVMTRLGTFWGELLTTVLLFIGGWKLRAYKKSGPRLLSVALWINMVLITFVIGSLVLIENLVPTGEDGDKPMAAGEAVLGALQFGALVFQIIALVWLRRNRAVLRDIFQSAATPRGPHGTMVIPPSAVVSPVPAWSLKAVWGAVLVGVSLVTVTALASLAAYFAANRRNFVSTSEIIWIVASLSLSLPALAGTILGWMGLSDVSHGGKRGAAFAIFASLFWPVILLAAFTVWVVAAPIRNFSEMAPFASFLLLLVPAGTVTFIIWAIYTVVRKATGQPAQERRGVLKWVFIVVLLTGMGMALVTNSSQRRASLQPPQSGTLAALPPGPKTKVVELSVFKDRADSIFLMTSSPLGPDEALVPILERMDGRREMGQFITSFARNNNRIQEHATMVWHWGKDGGYPPEEAKRIETLLEENFAGRPLALVAGQPLHLFSLTNRSGGILKCHLDYQPDFAGNAYRSTESDQAQVRVEQGIVSSSSGSSSTLILFLKPSIPAGHSLQPIADGTIGTSGSSQRTISQSSGNASFTCNWIFPGSFTSNDVFAAQAQCDKLRQTAPLTIPSGGRQLLFAVTNQAGEIHRGYLELVPPLKFPTGKSAALDTTNASIGWLRGTWIYDKEYSAHKTAELRASNAPTQKTFQGIATDMQRLGKTNAGPADLGKVVGEMTGTTLSMMNSMKETLETQVILDLLTGAKLTFDETEMRSVSRLAAPATIPYDEIKVINPTTMKVRWQGTNGGEYHLEGGRFRVDLDAPNLFAFYFKRVNSPDYQKAAARLEALLSRERELSATLTDQNPLLISVHRQIEDTRDQMKRMEQAP